MLAQSTAQFLLQQYVEAKVEKRDATDDMKRLETLFNRLKTSQEKKEFLNEVYSTIFKYQKQQQNLPTLPAIEVYLHFAEENDTNLPLLYYIKGDINAVDLQDTVALKACIGDLMLMDSKKDPKVKDYLTTLNKHLNDIRNYIPIYDRMMAGCWLSVHIATYEGLPYFVMWKNEDNVLLMSDAGEFVGREHRVVQNQVDLKKECAYLAWANEEMKTPGVMEVAFTNSVASEIGSRAGYALGNAFGSSFLGNVGGSVFSAGLSQLFASKPTKKVQFVESQMHMCNDFEIEMINHSQAIKAVQGEAEKNEFDTTYQDLLILYPYKDLMSKKVFFMDKNKNPFIYSGFDRGAFSNDMVDWEKAYFKKDGELFKEYEYYKELVKKNDALFAFNRLQTAKCFLAIQDYMNEHSMEMSKFYHSSDNGNAIGVALEQNSLKINKVYDSGTAKLYGLKKDDIIVGINDVALNDYDEFVNLLNRYPAFTKVKLQISRKGHLMEIPVEIGYKVKYHNY